MIRLNDIVVKFGDFTALHGINVHVKEGEFFTFLGPSGCGKTTTLRTLTGFIEPAEGTVIVGGKDITHVPIEDRNIGIVFQSYALFPTMTVYDNIAFGLKIKKMKKAEVDKRVREIAKKVDLSDEQLKKAVSQLSGGQQQRVAIARALATHPKVLLCDEATSALDPNTTHAILQLIQKINREMGITVVIITHQMSVVEDVCSHVAILDNGTVVEQGSVRDIFSNPHSDAAKRLVFPAGTPERELLPGRKMVRVAFNGTQTTDKPLVASLAIECGALVSIVAADTRVVNGQTLGSMLLALPEGEEAAKALDYIKNYPGITYEEVGSNG